MKAGWIAGHPHLRGVFILATLAALAAVGAFVDLAPAVDENFFFAGDDPAFRMDARLARTFPPRPQLIVAASGDLRSSAYYGAWGAPPPASATPRERVSETIEMTAGASWWGMVTTLAGFLSLLLVDARPLRELGLAGGIGAVVAYASAYLIFPSFLHTEGDSAAPAMPKPAAVSNLLPRLMTAARWVVAPGLLVAAVLIAPHARKIDTDPSLLSYFSEESEIREGLDQVDRNGGSSPLLFTARDAGGMRLDSEEAYGKLWSLQRALERHPSVGTVLSLPLIMSEAKRVPFGFLFNYRFLLDQGEKPRYGGITNAFVTQDRSQALYLMRMKENVPRDHRLEEIEEIRSIFHRNGFRTDSLGGLYFLQGKLSRLIRESLLTGVGQLIALFLIVGAIVARRLRWTLAMGAALAVGPALVLGGIGLLQIPVDIISAPAVNIAAAMGIADMIQLTTMARKLRKRGRPPDEAWARSLAILWKPAAATSLAVSAGFALFLLSHFPPTQRFGLAVVAGTAIALCGSLIVLPALAAGWRLGGGRPADAESRSLPA